MLEVNTVAAEMTDTAVIEGGSVLFCASIVLFPVYLDTVNIFAEPAPVEERPEMLPPNEPVISIMQSHPESRR